MVSRKLVGDFLLSKRPPFPLCLTSPQGLSTRLGLNQYPGHRQFSVFKKFSEQFKGEVNRNEEFQKSVKELREKAEELKGVKDEITNRTKQKTEQLYKHVDEVWIEAEATAKKVSANFKETLSAATEEVKESLGVGKQEVPGSSENASSREKTDKKAESDNTRETVFGKFKSSIPSPKMSSAFQKLREAKVTDLVRKGYEVVKDELSGTPKTRKHLEYTPPPPFKGEISSERDIVVLPSKKSRWSKMWETVREKVQGHPVFKHVGGLSEPVMTKGQEIAEDMRERWETSDNPVVHKIQDVGDTIFQETDAAASIKEIHRRDPSFSLPDFVVEVQEAIRPVLNAYMKGDVETLRKYCSPEVVNRCEVERKAFESHGMFFDNKILHISEVEVRETKMMGTSSIIIIAFQTQQVHCVRDRSGGITEGGKDTIHTVYYAWAMQQVDPEELVEGAIYPIWRLIEIQQLGVQALI